jgi:hypothetical protein
MTTHQHRVIGVPVMNPLVASSSVRPSPPNNVMVPHPASFYAVMQQPPPPPEVHSYPASINNPFVVPSLSVTNPSQGIYSSQLIGRNIQWQSIGNSGCNIQNSVTATAASYSCDGNDTQDNGNERIQSIRDRNRVHARSSRQRKKAYVHKLKSLVDGLHTELNEEMRKRTVAAQHSVDIQKMRRRVMVTFFNYHSRYQADPRKWSSILEESFWLKQPITPFRSFRGSEIENVSPVISDQQMTCLGEYFISCCVFRCLKH